MAADRILFGTTEAVEIDISAYLSDSITLEQTVEGLTRPVVMHFQHASTKADDLGLGCLWRPILLAAAKAPPAQNPNAPSPAHAKLLDLMAAIADKGPLKRDADGTVAKTWSGTAWTDLPMFGMAAREEWNDQPNPRGTGVSIAEWTAMNTFVALVTADKRLGQGGKANCDLSLYGVWGLRAALEEEWPRVAGDADVDRVAAKLEAWLPAAIAWLDNAGELIWTLCGQNEVYVKEGEGPDPARAGDLAKGKVSRGGYSVERWNYWRDTLTTISKMRDDASGREKVAKLAYHGLQTMERIQG